MPEEDIIPKKKFCLTISPSPHVTVAKFDYTFSCRICEKPHTFPLYEISIHGKLLCVSEHQGFDEYCITFETHKVKIEKPIWLKHEWAMTEQAFLNATLDSDSNITTIVRIFGCDHHGLRWKDIGGNKTGISAEIVFSGDKWFRMTPEEKEAKRQRFLEKYEAVREKYSGVLNMFGS